MSALRASVVAPAKVNLWLDVLAKRPDGYHEVDTGILALDLADRLTVEVGDGPGVALELSGPMLSDDVPRDRSNLAVRAAELVLADARSAGQVERGTGLCLALEKRVPSRAGLGGGSSDAAAAMLGAAHALGFRLDPGLARTRLAALGSDCAFFLDAGATGFARCTGRGEHVVPLAVNDRAWTVALLAPDVACPTGAVYAALESSGGRPLSARAQCSSVRESLLSRTEAEVRAGISNRLEAAALEAVPALRPWRDLLDENGAPHFTLSGSGSTFFGLFRDEAEARACLEELVRAARARRLAIRGTWSAHPSGTGAALAPADRRHS